jgi:hypothetical protein
MKEKENAKLQRLPADLSLENPLLKDIGLENL